jgi:quercetin dioxygenase-like cupin family protein
LAKIDQKTAFSALGEEAVQSLTGRKDVVMHRTASVDYAIVVEGEIWAVLDKGETLLKRGDVLIQRGTNHGWSNRGDRPALVAFVLVAAEPLKF